MKDFKQFIKALAVVLAALLTIIASAGAVNFGGFYAFAGVCNLGWLYFPIREVIKHLNARKDNAPAGNSGISDKPVGGNKTEREDINDIQKSE